MIRATTYTVPCSVCGQPVLLPFDPQTSKLCDGCYEKGRGVHSDQYARGRWRPLHSWVSEDDAEPGLCHHGSSDGRPLRGRRPSSQASG